MRMFVTPGWSMPRCQMKLLDKGRTVIPGCSRCHTRIAPSAYT